MIIRRGFRYRLYPTKEEIARLTGWENSLRFLWNLANEQRLEMRRRCKVDRREIMAFDQIRELTDLRAEVPWLTETPRCIQSQLLIELDLAWQKFFKKGHGIPQFKSKRWHRAPMAVPSNRDFRVVGSGHDGAVSIPKIGEIAAVIHRPLVGTPKQCAVVRDGDQWFASIVCEVSIADPVASAMPTVALDRGITALLADSDGVITSNPRFSATAERKFSRAKRSASRKVVNRTLWMIGPGAVRWRR